MTRKLKAILSDLKDIDTVIASAQCQCELAGDGAAHFHAMTCPVGAFARRQIELRLEYNQAYLKSPQHKWRQALAWLTRKHYTHMDLIIWIAITANLMIGNWIIGGLMLAVEVFCLCLERLNNKSK